MDSEEMFLTLAADLKTNYLNRAEKTWCHKGVTPNIRLG